MQKQNNHQIFFYVSNCLTFWFFNNIKKVIPIVDLVTMLDLKNLKRVLKKMYENEKISKSVFNDLFFIIQD